MARVFSTSGFSEISTEEMFSWRSLAVIMLYEDQRVAVAIELAGKRKRTFS